MSADVLVCVMRSSDAKRFDSMVNISGSSFQRISKHLSSGFFVETYCLSCLTSALVFLQRKLRNRSGIWVEWTSSFEANYISFEKKWGWMQTEKKERKCLKQGDRWGDQSVKGR